MVGPSKGESDDDLVVFDDELEAPAPATLAPWKVAVIDDDPAVHDGTRFALFDYQLDGHGLELLSAHSSAEGRALMEAHPDIAVVLLDVVMETDTAGLELVDCIRRVLKNDTVRIILRTGQPGQAPERDVIVDYDINDYKSKTELTAAKLFTTLTAALRGYRQLQRMVSTRRGLEIIIDATATLGDLKSLRRLGEGVLTQFASILDVECAGILVLRETADDRALSILAGSGRYSTSVGAAVDASLDTGLVSVIEHAFVTQRTEFTDERTILYIGTESGTEIVVVLDSRKDLSETDRALIGIFCNRLSASIDNLMLYEQVQEANRTLEQRVVQRTEELAAANRRLQDQWQRARRGSALQSEILGIVAHDLKNPLSTILSRAEVLDQLLTAPDRDGARASSQVAHIRDATRRMSAMADSLVADVMADAMDITLRREPNDLGLLVAEVAEANRPLAERKAQQLLVSIDFEEAAASFDYDRMRDAIDNLVSNAIKYSAHGQPIVVALEADGDAGVISVIDRGPGLKPEDFEHLFERFQRLSAKPTGDETSTGLGLSIVKRIIDLHGGSIEARSPGPGHGATFTLRLPLAPPA